MFKMTLPKTYIRVPERVQSSRLRRLLWVLTGAMRMPVYWLMASFHATPGLAFKAKCFALGLRLLFAPRTRRSPKIGYSSCCFRWTRRVTSSSSSPPPLSRALRYGATWTCPLPGSCP